MYNAVGFRANDNQLLAQYQQLNKAQAAATLEMGAVHKANAEVKAFENSPPPNKNNLNMKAALQLAGVSLLAIGGKLVYDAKNATIDGFINTVKDHANNIMESIKAPLRKIDVLKTAKQFISEYADNAAQFVKNIPGPIKYLAAAAGGAILLNRAYQGGKADGEHKALNAMGKAQAYEKMGNALQNINTTI